MKINATNIASRCFYHEAANDTDNGAKEMNEFVYNTSNLKWLNLSESIKLNRERKVNVTNFKIKMILNTLSVILLSMNEQS